MSPAVLLENKDIIPNPPVNSPDATTHIAAFLVLIGKNGEYVFEPDINRPIIPERKPTSHEVKGALSSLLLDFQAQETAMTTLMLQQQMMQGMMNQQQNQKVLAQINKGR